METNKYSPVQFQPQEIELSQLPSVLQQNQALAERAVSAITQKLNQISQLDIQQLPAEQGEIIDNELATLAIRGADSVKVNMERRMVYTKRMDEIKSLFTASEKNIQACVDSIKSWRDNWNKEKARRIAEQQRQLQEDLAKKNAVVEYTQAVVNTIGQHHTAQLKNVFHALSQAFYRQNLNTIAEYEQTLRNYVPVWQPFDYNITPHPLLDGEQMLKIRSECETESYSKCKKVFEEKVIEERNRLVELLPSRVMELQRIATDDNAAREAQERQQREQQEQQQKLEQEHQQQIAANNQNAETEKMGNIFEQASSVEPAVQLSKGTVQKKKYNPTTHKAFVSIIQWWVTNQMHTATLEDLNKKFSFMVTAANKALNEGQKIEAEGLLVEDDFSTRTTRSTSKK